MPDRIIVFAGQDLIVSDFDAEEPMVLGEVTQSLSRHAKRNFDWKGEGFEALALDEAGAIAAAERGLVRLPFRQALSRWSQETLGPVVKALALLNWLEGAHCCGACGSPLVAGEAGSLVCSSCGRTHFPRISPAVIVLVRKEGKALLARNARVAPGGRFGLLAGFVEAGETLEEAAAREVREEAGIEIRGLRYFGSQPWPFPDSLMLAFTAEWAGGATRPDGHEIAELRWCGPDQLPEIPPAGSVARRLIDDFVRSSSVLTS